MDGKHDEGTDPINFHDHAAPTNQKVHVPLQDEPSYVSARREQ